MQTLTEVSCPPGYPWRHIATGTWRYDPDTSFAAGFVYLYVPPEGGVPEVILVHQTPGEAFRQIQTKEVYTRKPLWKLPVGRHDPERDHKDPLRTARVEVTQETGGLDIKDIMSWDRSLVLNQFSRRPGSDFHEDIYFWALTSERRPIGAGLAESRDDTDAAVYCPIDRLPLRKDEGEARFLGDPLSRNHMLVLAEVLKRVPADEWWGRRVDEDLVNTVVGKLIFVGTSRRG